MHKEESSKTEVNVQKFQFPWEEVMCKRKLNKQTGIDGI